MAPSVSSRTQSRRRLQSRERPVGLNRVNRIPPPSMPKILQMNKIRLVGRPRQLGDRTRQTTRVAHPMKTRPRRKRPASFSPRARVQKATGASSRIRHPPVTAPERTQVGVNFSSSPPLLFKRRPWCRLQTHHPIEEEIRTEDLQALRAGKLSGGRRLPLKAHPAGQQVIQQRPRVRVVRGSF